MQRFQACPHGFDGDAERPGGADCGEQIVEEIKVPADVLEKPYLTPVYDEPVPTLEERS